MAGDWIPMRLDLGEDPAVMQMATKLDCREELIVGYLHKVWSWMSRQMCDNRVTGVTLVSLGRVTNLPGFPELMCDVGWLVDGEDDGVPFVEVPNFERWLAKSAKTRLKAAERQKSSRSKRDNVTNMSRSQRDKSVTTEEKRTEENKGSASSNVSEFLTNLKSKEIDKEILSLLEVWILAIDASGKFNAIAQEFEVAKLLTAGWSKPQMVASIENSIGGPYPKFYEQTKTNGKPVKKSKFDGVTETRKLEMQAAACRWIRKYRTEPQSEDRDRRIEKLWDENELTEKRYEGLLKFMDEQERKNQDASD